MRRRFRQIFGPDPPGDVDAELAFHIDMRTRELAAKGEAEQVARERAYERFGNYDQSRAACLAITARRERRMVRLQLTSELRHDVRYALRGLARAPGFAAVAILILSLGIGANTAIFSVVQAALGELPYTAADRLYDVRTVYPDGTRYSLSAPDFMSVAAGAQTLEGAVASTTGMLTLAGMGDPREVRGAQVSRGFFGLLGFQIHRGRGFSAEDHEPGRGMVAVLDHGFWVRELGADPGVVGRTLSLRGEPYTIVGILAPEPRFLEPVDVYAPLVYGATFSPTAAQGRRSEFLEVLARARSGVGPAQIDADLGRIGRHLQEAFPASNERLTFGASPARDLVVGDARRPLLILFGAVALVLLVASANVASLLLARGSARQSELAIRTALGAGRGRLVRQLLVEAMVLAAAGAAGGILLAYWGTRALVAAAPAGIPRLDEVTVDATVVLFAAGVAMLTALVFGTLPALHATGARLMDRIREGGRGGSEGRGGHRARAALVVVETALAVVLLVGAGLFIRSFVELTRVHPGFSAEQAVSFRVMLQGPAYPDPPALRQRIEDLVSRLGNLPGVRTAAATTLLPLSGRGALLNFAVEGAPPPPADVNAEIAVASVTPRYFGAIGVPVVRGRGFDERDRDGAPAVAVVNEAAVRQWFPAGDALGQRVEVGPLTREIVGIVGDVLQRGPGVAALPQLYVPFGQSASRSVRFVLRSEPGADVTAAAVREVVKQADPGLAVADFGPMEGLFAKSIAAPRFYTSLLTLFAGAALVLAATGVFGVMSYAVVQRTREIGIRMALGARAANVIGMILGRAALLLALGLGLGLAAAIGLGRFVSSQLYGVRPVDPLTLAAVVAVLVASALLASYVPARRAARIDPYRALRQD